MDRTAPATRASTKRKQREEDEKSKAESQDQQREIIEVTDGSSEGAPVAPGAQNPASANSSIEILDAPPPKRARKNGNKKKAKKDEGSDAASGSARTANSVIIKSKNAHTVIPEILSILPDVCPTALYDVVCKQLGPHIFEGEAKEDFMARAIETLFQDGTGYTKAKKEERGKLPAGYWKLVNKSKAGSSKAAPAGPETYDAPDNYLSESWNLDERSGAAYTRDALFELENMFLMVPMLFIRSCLDEHNGCFAPTMLALMQFEGLAKKQRPYSSLKNARKAKSSEDRVKKSNKRKSGSSRASVGTASTEADNDEPSTALAAEKIWLIDHLFSKGDDRSIEYAQILQGFTELAEVECGCCFGEFVERAMLQCTEGHLFCRSCLSTLVKTCLGDQRAPATCMHTDGCTATFADNELEKCVEAKAARAYHKLCQRKELQEAAIEGLEGCPECDYAVIVENPEEKLFYCQAEDCGLISCRGCRQPEHLPYTCDQASADRKLDKRHTVEEAMTEALVRKCPKCEKAFVKTEGCNKITCSNCGALSCYVCRKVVTNGYNHFEDQRGFYGSPPYKNSGRCPLWESKDPKEQDKEIEQARRLAQARALEEARRDGIQLNEDDLRVELRLPKKDNATPAPARNARMHLLADVLGLRQDQMEDEWDDDEEDFGPLWAALQGRARPHNENPPRVPPQAAPMPPQAAPILPQAARMPPQAAPIPPPAARMPAQDAPVPAQAALIPRQAALDPAQAAPIPAQAAPIPAQAAPPQRLAARFAAAALIRRRAAPMPIRPPMPPQAAQLPAMFFHRDEMAAAMLGARPDWLARP